MVVNYYTSYINEGVNNFGPVCLASAVCALMANRGPLPVQGIGLRVCLSVTV